MDSSIMSDRNLNPVMEPNFLAYSCSNIVTMMNNWWKYSHHITLTLLNLLSWASLLANNLASFPGHDVVWE